jgi:phosphatidylserine/phosphatidylglycerophosphate/cardiolipin synthase-like enzyme
MMASMKVAKPYALVALLIALLVGLLIQCSAAMAAEAEVCFAPPSPGGCDPTDTIVRVIAAAHKQILMQAYEFTSAPIAKAIVDAHRRGLEVRVILDKSNLHEGYSAAKFFTDEGVPVTIDSAHNIAHNKVMILDRETVITGSFNFTKAAEERNAENLVVIHDPVIAAAYLRNWESHARHSSPIGIPQDQQGKVASKPSTVGVNPKISAGQVVGNRHSHIYAWPGCGSYDTMSPQNRVVFVNRQAAEEVGFRPARNCP